MKFAFKTSYKRPTKLSDPYNDFTPELLKNLLLKSDDDLDSPDYINLFGPHLPAGKYDEVMYFLPQAFLYLKTHEDDALDMVTAIFGFCSINIQNLETDGLADIVRKEISGCLYNWIKDFQIIHFDKAACKQKGWGVDYFDYVKNTEVICEATSDLVEFNTLTDLAIKFVNSLAYNDGDITKASWFLEYSRSRFDVYTPPNLPEITSIITDEKLLNEAYSTVWVEVMNNKITPTYWRDTFNKIGL